MKKRNAKEVQKVCAIQAVRMAIFNLFIKRLRQNLGGQPTKNGLFYHIVLSTTILHKNG